jgi:hypothetical protein
MVAIGNGTGIGLSGNGEPFLINYNSYGNNTQFFTPETTASHTIGIWHKVESGSSSDVRYVTFKSYDGSVEYGKKAVAVGDDCADPIARGIFSTPTRESDAQYNYTHNGWATEPNGTAVSNWNKAVTEDKIVYATFTATVRSYTITYYDDDGTTVLKAENLTYGFACLMKIYSGIRADGDKFVCDLPTRQIQIQDDLPYLEYFANGGSVKEFMQKLDVWGEDLTEYKGFYEKVEEIIKSL